MRIASIVIAGALALAAAMPVLAADGHRLPTSDRRTDLLQRPEVAPVSSPTATPLIQQLLAGNQDAPTTPTAASNGDSPVVFEPLAVELGKNEVTRQLDDVQLGFEELQVRRRESKAALDRFLREQELGYVVKRLEVPAEVLEQRRTR